MTSFKERIEILNEYRACGQSMLNKVPKLKLSVRNQFRRSMANAYRDRMTECLRQSEEYVDAQMLQQNAGVSIDTAGRILPDRKTVEDGGKSLEFANWLAIVFVYKLPWNDLEVRSRRDVVVNAMLEAMSRIRVALESQTAESTGARMSSEDTAEYPRLTRQQWECLRRIHLSGDWLEASQIRGDGRRRAELIRIAEGILKSVKAEFSDDENHSGLDEPEELLSLVRDWHCAWTAFFGAVQCRWRF